MINTTTINHMAATAPETEGVLKLDYIEVGAGQRGYVKEIFGWVDNNGGRVTFQGKDNGIFATTYRKVELHGTARVLAEAARCLNSAT